jgi:hypothetical protein
MLGAAIRRLASGALWGLGAAAVLALANPDTASLRPTAKRLMRVGVATADRLQELAAEAQEALGDLYAEVRAEQAAASPTPPESADGLIPIVRPHREVDEPDDSVRVRR